MKENISLISYEEINGCPVPVKYIVDGLSNDTQKLCIEVRDFLIVLYYVMYFSYSFDKSFLNISHLTNCRQSHR